LAATAKLVQKRKKEKKEKKKKKRKKPPNPKINLTNAMLNWIGSRQSNNI
jgi:hypothetical protein